MSKAAWIITFIAGVVSAVNGKFLNIAWWAIAFFFVCILAVSLAVALDLVLNYHVAVSIPTLPLQESGLTRHVADHSIPLLRSFPVDCCH